MGDQISTLSLQELQTVRQDLITKLKRVNDRMKILMEEETRRVSDSAIGAGSRSSDRSENAEKAVAKKKVMKKPAVERATVVVSASTSGSSAGDSEESDGLLKKVTMDDMKFILTKNKIEWSSSMKRADLMQLVRSNALVRKALKYHNDRDTAKSGGRASAADSD